MKLTIALMQLLPADGLERQYEKAAQACQKAKALGADIALFPEMWSCGYRIPERLDELRALATPAEGEWVAAFGDLACRLEMAVGITLIPCPETAWPFLTGAAFADCFMPKRIPAILGTKPG